MGAENPEVDAEGAAGQQSPPLLPSTISGGDHHSSGSALDVVGEGVLPGEDALASDFRNDLSTEAPRADVADLAEQQAEQAEETPLPRPANLPTEEMATLSFLLDEEAPGEVPVPGEAPIESSLDEAYFDTKTLEAMEVEQAEEDEHPAQPEAEDVDMLEQA
ncbi:hypothetical protein VTK56DRAFT_4832 [Thermocarpiscus australiensis]